MTGDVFEVPAEQLVFGQPRASTIELLGSDWLAFPLERFPHYLHLRGEADLRDYLEASWRDVPGPSRSTRAHVCGFECRVRAVERAGEIAPIEVVRRGDAWIVADGNHRSSIALFLGLPISAIEIDVGVFLGRAVMNPRLRYGTRPGRPYQTVRARGSELIAGRRDLTRRHALIDATELHCATVLDIGCNIGASAFFAHESGAAVTGWDVEPGLVTSALRIALALGYDVTLRSVDAVTPPNGAEWDVGFCFSVHEHASVGNALARCRVVYLETHRPSPPPPEIADGFTVEKLGEYDDGGVRRLYRMSRR